MYIYNTLTRQKELFEPIDVNRKKVKIYDCGPTVYGFFHIGNARNFVIFDVLRRYLKYKGYEVTFVQNITDIDDKIINKAIEEKTTWREIANKYTLAYFEDIKALGIEEADYSPKATELVPEMIEFITGLIKQGTAYEVEGNVYYDIAKFSSYGKLSGKKIEELEAGARVEIDERKKHPLDFALWKKAKPNEPSWISPWGEGRPGWHIECSVMSRKYLGDTFDIHGGGIDLVFPHHENEKAQTEALTGKPFAKYWLHNGHLNFSGEKMSKSIGNIKLVHELIAQKYSPLAIRYFLLSAHYRSPLDFSEEILKSAQRGYEEFCNTFYRIKELCEIPASDSGSAGDNELKEAKAQKSKEKFIEAMEDDFNTALAAGSLFELAREVKHTIADKSFTIESLKNVLKILFECSSILGIAPKLEGLGEEEMQFIKNREEARKQKDWASADRIREQLKEKGIILEDTPSGTLALKKKS